MAQEGGFRSGLSPRPTALGSQHKGPAAWTRSDGWEIRDVPLCIKHQSRTLFCRQGGNPIRPRKQITQQEL